MRLFANHAIVFLISPLLAWAAPEPNQAEKLSQQVAQVVYGILSYSRWPADKDQLRLCVAGPTEYADILLGTQSSEDQIPVIARRYSEDASSLRSQCDALYLGGRDTPQRQELLRALADAPLLTISEESDGCSVGSLFCLQTSNERVSFAVNLDAVARSGIRVHPQVLSLGKRRDSKP